MAENEIDIGKIARSLEQRLTINRLFGWDVPLRKERLAPRRAAPSAAPSSADPSAVAPAAAPARLGVEPSADLLRPPAFLPASRPFTLAGERAGKEALLSPLREEVRTCARCALCHGRTQAVFGTGDPTTRLMFVGEAPGFEEDRQGEPFVGKAGQLLNEIIKAMGLGRSQVYIANVIKCRPPQNRVPNPAEVGSCFGYLEAQIGIVKPEVLVALGGVAAKALLGVDLPMGRLRGRFHDWRGLPLMPTYHPAYLLRNPQEKRKVWEDIQLVMARLGLPRATKAT
jgi:DNA polymerase